jgi:hypothetical protein
VVVVRRARRASKWTRARSASKWAQSQSTQRQQVDDPACLIAQVFQRENLAKPLSPRFEYCVRFESVAW